MRHNVSACGAAYLAVAVQHEARLVTLDGRLSRAAAQIAPSIPVTVL